MVFASRFSEQVLKNHSETAYTDLTNLSNGPNQLKHPWNAAWRQIFLSSHKNVVDQAPVLTRQRLNMLTMKGRLISLPLYMIADIRQGDPLPRHSTAGGSKSQTGMGIVFFAGVSGG